MGLFDRFFGRSDVWSRVPQPVAAALSARLSPALFAQLTATLAEHKLFTPAFFQPTWASLPARDIVSKVALQLVLTSMGIDDRRATRDASWLGRQARIQASEDPWVAAKESLLTLSLEIEPRDNFAMALLPLVLLERGKLAEAQALAQKSLALFDGLAARTAPDQDPDQWVSTEDDGFLMHDMAKIFVQQVEGGTDDPLQPLRTIAEGRTCLAYFRAHVSDGEFILLRTLLASYLKTRGIAVDPHSDAIDAHPLLPGDFPEFSAFLASIANQFAEHGLTIPVLELAHRMDPERLDVNTALAQLYSQAAREPVAPVGGVDADPDEPDAAALRVRALRHAALALPELQQLARDEDGIIASGIPAEQLNRLLAEMERIVAAGA
jgi:hypothetical protein